MQRIALPIAGTRVSPLFDVAQTLLLADIENGAVVQRASHPIRTPFPPARVRLLSEFNVDTLICGGISRPVEMWVRAEGIQVISWVAGEIDEVLVAFTSGRLMSAQFMMPGCWGRGRGRGQRRRRGAGWNR